jgi:hypothetical protein
MLRYEGYTDLHIFITYGQRGWKWHPGGGFSGEGISPDITENPCFSGFVCGTDFIRLCV